MHMEQALELLAIGLVVAGGAAAILWHVLQGATDADNRDELFDALKDLGFLPQRDARDWIASRLPRMDLRHVYVSRSKYERVREESVPVPLAARDDGHFHQAVFLLPPSLRRTHDRLVFAVDPKRSAVISLPNPSVQDEVRSETGWDFEAHGAWLVLYRRQPVETTAENIGRVVEEALAVARRLLGAGVR